MTSGSLPGDRKADLPIAQPLDRFAAEAAASEGLRLADLAPSDVLEVRTRNTCCPISALTRHDSRVIMGGGTCCPRRREAGWPSVFTCMVKRIYYYCMTSTISSKGQVTVPKGVRDRLGFRTGTIVEFEITGAGVLLRKGHKGMRPVDRVRGILGRSRSTDDLINEMRGPAPAARGARR